MLDECLVTRKLMMIAVDLSKMIECRLRRCGGGVR